MAFVYCSTREPSDSLLVRLGLCHDLALEVWTATTAARSYSNQGQRARHRSLSSTRAPTLTSSNGMEVGEMECNGMRQEEIVYDIPSSFVYFLLFILE